MKKPLILGSFLGVLLTIGAGYYLYVSKALSPKTVAGAPVVATQPEPVAAETPAATTNVQYKFHGHEDLLATRAKQRLMVSPERWDEITMNANLSSSVRTTTACRYADLSPALYVKSIYAESALNRTMNVVGLNFRTHQCYSVGSEVTLIADDAASSGPAYRILGTAVIQRLMETPIETLPAAFMDAIGLNAPDKHFFFNHDFSIPQIRGQVTLVLFEMKPDKPLLDPTTVPPFIAGAVTLKAKSIDQFFKAGSSPIKPVFVDARARTATSPGAETYPGAISAPFFPSQANQLRFELNMPLSVLAGSRFDTRALPKDKNTPLLIYGENDKDPSPIWMIRNLRIQHYQNLYLISGGLEALKKEERITF
ncbi:MAG: hypothetical protein RBT63_05940 [Bdellovibrionales bacterium]|jgi:hypothetical protein|nr:hypothetical protein [Bdellovibrionales bacterium]